MNWTCFFQSSFHDKFTVIACSYFYSTALDLSNITEFCSESKGSINWNLLISLLLLSFFNCVLEQVPTQKQQSCLFHTFGTLCPHRNCRWEENVRLLNIVLLVFLLSLCKFWFFLSLSAVGRMTLILSLILKRHLSQLISQSFNWLS